MWFSDKKCNRGVVVVPVIGRGYPTAIGYRQRLSNGDRL